MEKELDQTQQTISSEEITRLYIELIQIQARIRQQDGFIKDINEELSTTSSSYG